jgi:drug/metabolite transporter (DMT)-like permease
MRWMRTSVGDVFRVILRPMEGMPLTKRTSALVHRWWPFALLLLTGATRWAFVAAHPEIVTTPGSEFAGCGLAAVLSLLLLVRGHRRSSAPRCAGELFRAILAGAMMLGGPMLGLLVRSQTMDAAGLVIAMALTPAVIAVASSALGAGTSEGLGRSIWPGLAATAGLLLLLPQQSLGNLRADAAFVLAPILTGTGAVLLNHDRTEELLRVSLALVGASLFFGFCLAETRLAGGPHAPIRWMGVVSDGSLATLGILSLVRLGAERWSAQFTLVPLLIVVEGFVLLHTWPGVQSSVAIASIAAASGYLLRPRENVVAEQRVHT